MTWHFSNQWTATSRLTCPSTLRACSNSCPSSRWCHPSNSSSVLPFSSCLQSLPVSRTIPMIKIIASGGQIIGASSSASILPMSIQDWFLLVLTDLISLQSKRLSRVFSNTTVQKHQFFGIHFLYAAILTSILDYKKNHSLTRQIFVGKVMSLLFNPPLWC